MPFWNYDESNSDGEVWFADSKELGFTVMLEVTEGEEYVHIHIFPLYVIEHPFVTYTLPRDVLPKHPSLEEPIIIPDEPTRMHIPIVDADKPFYPDNPGNVVQLLVNATHEGFIFDLYDNEDEFWTAAIPYEEVLEGADEW